jgi:TRAP-type uncharacterized transport system substrate-binding protein
MEEVMTERLKIFARAATALALFFNAAPMASAQTSQQECGLRIASGPAGKIYALMVRDMQSVCGAVVDICAIHSSGGLQNLSLLAANEGDLGIVQIDTLSEMTGDENIAALQAVMPLHANLLHVITLSEGSLVGVTTVAGAAVPFTGHKRFIRRFSELKGLKVAAVGSAQLMAQMLERQLNYGMSVLTADSDEQALEMLRGGDVQAVFTLGGWPLPAITRLPSNGGLMLADYDLVPPAPYFKVKRNYQNLDAFNLNFLGVPNLLVSRAFKAGGSMGTLVGALRTCLREHLDELQEGRYQAAWKEIKDPGATYGVKPLNAKVTAGASN